MPPRRTTRKASVAPSTGSPEPESTSGRSSRSAATKRKRTEAELEKVLEAENEVQASEDEEAPRKPSSRVRKTTTRQPSATRGKGRATTARKVSAQSIVEEEEDAPSPPKKTKRRSGMITEDDEEEDIDDPQPKRVSARTKPPSRVPARSRKVMKTIESDEEAGDDSEIQEDSSEDEQPKRTVRGTKQTVRGSSKKVSSTRSTKTKVKKELTEEAEESAVIDSEAEELKDQDSPSSSKPTSTGLGEQGPISVPTTDAEEQEVEEIATPRAATRIAPRSAMLAIPKEKDESDDEPERSLLDDLPTSAAAKPMLSAAPQPPVPDEPQGPKSRLVIHKMVLVNFKSYAGRQVIGPFHKVGSGIYYISKYVY